MNQYDHRETRQEKLIRLRKEMSLNREDVAHICQTTADKIRYYEIKKNPDAVPFTILATLIAEQKLRNEYIEVPSKADFQQMVDDFGGVYAVSQLLGRSVPEIRKYAVGKAKPPRFVYSPLKALVQKQRKIDEMKARNGDEEVQRVKRVLSESIDMIDAAMKKLGARD